MFDDLNQQVAKIVEDMQSRAITDTEAFILRDEVEAMSDILRDLALNLGYFCQCEDFIIGGLDERRVVETLSCTWPELRRWRFPEPEGSVRSFEWKSAGKYTVPTVAKGWRAETIEALKPKVEILREQHKTKRKAKSRSALTDQACRSDCWVQRS
jgi:hypothetical protein